MKKYFNILLICGILPLLFIQLMTSCSEDDTLEGAKEIYLTINPRDPFILVGDTVDIRAYVLNLSGDTIRTSIKWTSDDTSIVEIYNDKLVAQDGAQGKSTKVRATLTNGKYAVTTVTVSRHTPDGVSALEDVHYTYNKNSDTVWFNVSPINYLLDYEPILTNSNPSVIIPAKEPVYIDKSTGRVGYVFSSSNKYAKGIVKISLEGGAAQTTETQVVVSPSIVSSLVDDYQYITYESGMLMDINKEDTLWIYTKVDPSYEIDLANAEEAYNISISGNAAQMFDTGVKVVQNRGHNVYVALRSGNFIGQSVVTFECNGTTLTTTIDVQDYANQYPVDELSVDRTEITMRVGNTVYVTPSVLPVSSFGLHLPVFTPVDPTVVGTVGYLDNEYGLRGLRVGETDVIVTSNDKSIVIKVTVLEGVQSVVIQPGLQSSVFVGQSIQWFANVRTASGDVVVSTWNSSNEDISIIDDECIIKGLYACRTSITSEAGGVLSSLCTLTVSYFLSELFYYTNTTTDIDGNAAYIDDNLIILLAPTSGPFDVFQINVKPSISLWDVENGTYSDTNCQLSIEAGGAIVETIVGSITITDGPESYTKTINGELTVQLGTQSFTVTLTDLTVYI